MRAQANLSIEPPWAWTDESREVYEWAVRRLQALRVRGPIADIGCGTGHGTKMIMDAGLRAVGIEPDPDAVIVPGVTVERRAYRRDDVRRRGIYAATVIVGLIGWYGHERKIMETAMRDSGFVLADTIYPETWFAWMRPQPTFSELASGRKVLEWKR